MPRFNDPVKQIIECDGVYWHNFPLGTEKDRKKEKFLISQNIRFIRFWEFDIYKAKEKVKLALQSLICD